MKKKVAILYGGKGLEHDVSIAGAKNLLRLIDRERYIPIPIYIERGGTWRTEDGEEVTLSPKSGLTKGGAPLGCEVVFPLLHGDFGEDGSIAGALEMLGIDYVGCRAGTGALLIDKVYTKMLAESVGIKTVPYVVSVKGEEPNRAIDEAEVRLGYPMFVKPATLGSSIGAAKVDTKEELEAALSEALSLADKALIEKYITARREIEVGYLSYDGGEIISAGGEIATDCWYDYKEKYSERSRARVLSRADLPNEVNERLKNFTERLVRLFGIRQISRLDYFLIPEGIYLNEINTMPGFTEASLYPRLIAECGIPEARLVTLLIEGASL